MEEKNDIGYYARYLDTEFSIADRMKVSTKTIYRLFIALCIYSITMIILYFLF